MLQVQNNVASDISAVSVRAEVRDYCMRGGDVSMQGRQFDDSSESSFKVFSSKKIFCSCACFAADFLLPILCWLPAALSLLLSVFLYTR